MEYVFEGDRLADGTASPSFFTGAIVEGIRSGNADQDQDDYIGLGELYDYVYARVRECTPYQTPTKWEFGLERGLYLARNPHLRSSPAALPPEIDELIKHRLSTVRLQAVEWLSDLVLARNLATATAARDSLFGLEDDDSRPVTAAARTALTRCTVSLAKEDIDLGNTPLGRAAVARWQ